MQVEVGGLQKEARRLNEAFARYIRHGMPLVTLKAAMTLDGKIAAAACRKFCEQNSGYSRAEDGSRARSRARTCRNCGTRMTR